MHFSTKSRKASGQKLTKQTEHPIFVGNENILLITHHDKDSENDYVDYNRPNTIVK